MKRTMNANEEFIQPEGPVRRLAGSQHLTPISPDMKNARNRLGNLLSGIRKGDIGTFGDTDDHFDTDQSFIRRGPGRPKRSKRERRVIFELRNKVFSVRDSYAVEQIYPLMRKWIYGKDDDLPPASDVLPASPDGKSLATPSSYVSEDSLDLMATKEIIKMPDPLPLSDAKIPVMRVCAAVANPLPQGSAANDLLQEHVKAWKSCRKQHKKYMEIREKKFEPSLKLLKTVHFITQQTTQ